MLNATWLETFTTLCDVGHFTRTAELLGMTQPGVSQHLRKLEAQVGKPLIAQEGKSFTLTPAGEAVLKIGSSRRVQERALREAIQVDSPDAGVVSIGCSGSFSMWLYPHLLQRMQHAPDLVLRLTAAPQSGIVDAVLKGDMDLGVVTGSVEHARLEVVQIAREELCLVVPATYDAADLDLERLNALGFIAHPDGFAYADDLLSLNYPDQYKGSDRLRIRSFVNQIGQIPFPVAQGLGYTILPKSGVDAFAGKGDLAIVPLPHQRFNTLSLVCVRGRTSFARVKAISDLITRVTVALE